MYVFLEVGVVYYKSIVNNSRYERWENGVLVASKKMDMSGITRTLGIGLAIGNRNTLAFNLPDYTNDMHQATRLRKLTYTRFL